jgi:hypothetical protein
MTTDTDSGDSSEGGWVTINQAAELTGRHPNSIRNWLRQGRLHHVREEPHPGGVRYLLREDEVVALTSSRERSSSLPTTHAGWDRLAAQVRGLAELVEEGAEVRRRLSEAEAQVERLEAENRELRERLEGRG